MMLSVENLREYCRTCLVKLIRTEEDNSSKSIPIKQFPDLEHLIQVCLAKPTDDLLCCYTPFLCCSCFEKWFEFTKLYQLATKTDAKIKKILEKELLETVNIDNVKQNENIEDYFINTETLVDIHEIEKYETDSPFYTNDHTNNSFNNIQHKVAVCDPTQINRQFKHDTKNSMQLIPEKNEDCSSSYSDNTDEIDFTSELKNKKVIKINNAQKNNSTRKSLRVLEQTYKTRKSLIKFSENHIADLSKNAAKKVRYQCEQCSKYFWEKNRYDGHMKQVHEGIKRPYKCQQCDKTYNLYKTLLQHKREYHSEKSREVFKCDRCDKIFKTRVILKQHLSNKHSEQKETMRSICDQCGFIAAHQYSLSRHIINKHTEPDQIKCDQCPKVFKTQYSLNYHVIGNHNPSNIKPFKCSQCQMGFTRKTLLNQHKRTHLKYTERIKCDFEGCEVRFVKRGDKAHHMRLVHLKIKQHICDFCGEAFGAMQTLIHHRFIHTGEKPYKCNVCGQGFRQRTAMKTHRKTHFGKETEGEDLINNLPEINLSLVNNLNS